MAMTIHEITLAYYSQWTGLDMNNLKSGCSFRYNPERDVIPRGYSRAMDVYIFATENLLVVSYGNKAKETIESSREKIKNVSNIASLKTLLENTFSEKVERSIKYIYTNNTGRPTAEAVVLKNDQYELFLEFFKANNPHGKEYSWVEDYFMELTSKKYCHGILVDGKLVSATDAPDMPYMQGLVQEIGINTLQDYRGRGYARAACVSLITELLSKNICPLWSTGETNAASDALARTIGFKKLADVLTVRITA
jgi:hypothetical protein